MDLARLIGRRKTSRAIPAEATVASGEAVALWALLGIPMLIAGFAINPGPPRSDTTSQLVTYGLNHQAALTVGGWLQVTGTVLVAIFALSVVLSARRANTVPGVLVLAGSTLLVVIGLSELTAYKVLASGHLSTARVATDVIAGVQLGYSIVAAPLIFGALGYLVLQSKVLPRALGSIAIGLGLTFWVCGLITVVTPIQGFINLLSVVQAMWWLGAGSFVGARGLSHIPTDTADQLAAASHPRGSVTEEP